MLKKLESYYKSKGILSTSFTCRYKEECSTDCTKFTGPKSAFVSTGYESGDLPRLLFLSLDSGSGEIDSYKRLPNAVRQQNEVERDTLTLPKPRHWYRTHELAWYVLKRFDPELTVENVKHWFAHANSAKCCMNKDQRKQADRLLFKNCQKYLHEELAILNPKILISQGNAAKFAIQSISSQTLQSFDNFAHLVKLNGKTVFWLHTFHPNNWGSFNKQRNFNKKLKTAMGWVSYSGLILEFVNQEKRHSETI